MIRYSRFPHFVIIFLHFLEICYTLFIYKSNEAVSLDPQKHVPLLNKNDKGLAYGNQPCKRVRYFFTMKNETCNEKCLQIRPYGRFGNHLICFRRAVQLAELTGIKEIVVFKGFLQINKSFIYHNVNITILSKRKFKRNKKRCFFHNFYHPIPRLFPLPLKVDTEMKNLFMQTFPANVSTNALVIHIRAGDVFSHKHKLYKYGQPPCNYFLDVVRLRNWSEVILLSEDDTSFCIPFLKKYNIIYKKHSFPHDLAIMLHSTNLVLSVGTLDKSIAMLSTTLRNLYSFNLPSPQLMDHMNCVPTKEYKQTILTNWDNENPYQKELMLTSPCMKWKMIRNQPNYEIDIDNYLDFGPK